MTEDASHRIPITVLTGFLGSGKTTLINTLLRRPNLRDTAVIVNELGDIPIDHLLVVTSTDNVVVLDSGCLCCVVLDSFKETLADLYHRRSRAEVPPFSRVIVETTGLADPAPLLQVLLRDSFVSYYFELAALVTTVDAVFGTSQYQTNREALKQTALADRIVITKAEIVSTEALARVREAIVALNPLATIHLSRDESFCVESVLLDAAVRESLINSRSSLAVASLDEAFQPVANMPSSGKSIDHSILSSHLPSRERHVEFTALSADHHDASVRSKSFVTDRALHWAGLAGWSELVRNELGSKLLRCKGLIRIDGLDTPVLLQGVQAVFAPPTRLPAWPSDDHRTRLVCITQGVPDELLDASFAALFAEPGTYPPASINELLSRNAPQ